MTLGFLSKSASWIPMTWVRPVSGVGLVVPYYHMVSDAHVPHVSHLYKFRSTREFTADLEFFLRHFDPLTLSDVVEILNGPQGRRRPGFHLTFDDGFREMHEIVVPILDRYGISGTFFLNTAFLDGGGLAHHNVLGLCVDRLRTREGKSSGAVLQRLEEILPAAREGSEGLPERILSIPREDAARVHSVVELLGCDVGQYIREEQPYLSSEQVRSMLAKGFSIGSHSHDHPHYKDLTLAEQVEQTRASMNMLDEKFRMSPRAFAFPHNDTGVTLNFFARVFAELSLDVSFGTGGLAPHFYPRNIERVKMEGTSASARQILTRQFARAAYFRARGRLAGSANRNANAEASA